MSAPTAAQLRAKVNAHLVWAALWLLLGLLEVGLVVLSSGSTWLLALGGGAMVCSGANLVYAVRLHRRVRS